MACLCLLVFVVIKFDDVAYRVCVCVCSCHVRCCTPVQLLAYVSSPKIVDKKVQQAICKIHLCRANGLFMHHACCCLHEGGCFPTLPGLAVNCKSLSKFKVCLGQLRIIEFI